MIQSFLVPSVRFDMMKVLISSWQAQSWKGEFSMVAILQDYSDSEVSEVLELASGLKVSVVRMSRTPPFMARQIAVRQHPEVDVWVYIDDDMEFTRETNFFIPIQRVLNEPACGIISCNWVRTESAKLRARCRYENTFIKQPLVNMSGGCVMRKDVADKVANWTAAPYCFCDIQQALIAYVSGYDNYRYLGSILIHRIMFSGGLIKSYREREFVAPEAHYMKLKPLAKKMFVGGDGAQNYHMPQSSDLLPLAHQHHIERRAEM